MIKLFFYELFEVSDSTKIFVCLFKKMIVLASLIVMMIFFNVILRWSWLKNNIYFFLFLPLILTCYLKTVDLSIINKSCQVFHGKIYKFALCAVSFFISDISVVCISFLFFLYNTNQYSKLYLVILYIFFFLSNNIFSILSKCRLASTHKKLSIFLRLFLFMCSLFLIVLKNVYLFIGSIFIESFVLALGFNNIFQEKISEKKNRNFIEKSFSRKTIVTLMFMEVIFLVRVKAKYFALAVFSFVFSILFFPFLKIVNPDMFLLQDDFKIFLFYSFLTGVFASVLGPYLINWFYFYMPDLLSKNFTVENILDGKILFLKSTVFMCFILSVPFVHIFSIDFTKFLFFALMNFSLVPFISLFFSSIGLSKVDVNKNPRVNNDGGNIFSSYLPWICQFISIGIYMLLQKLQNKNLTLIIGLLLFVIFLATEKEFKNILQHVINRKIDLIYR